MSSPSIPSDSIAYLTCVGLGLLAASAQPVQASEASPDAEPTSPSANLLSEAETTSSESELQDVAVSVTPAATFSPTSERASDELPSASLPPRSVSIAADVAFDSATIANDAKVALLSSADLPIAEIEASTEVAALERTAALAIDAIDGAVVPQPNGDLGEAETDKPETNEVALAFQPLDPTAEILIVPPEIEVAVPSEPEIAARPAGANLQPAYQVVTTTPPMPVIEIAAAEPSFNPTEQFHYQPTATTGNFEVASVEVVEPAPPEPLEPLEPPAAFDMATPDAPAVSPVSAAPATPLYAAADPFVFETATPAPAAAPLYTAANPTGFGMTTPAPVAVPLYAAADPAAFAATPAAPEAFPLDDTVDPVGASGLMGVVAQGIGSDLPPFSSDSPASAADLVNPNRALTGPIMNFQSAFLYQEDDLSARGRLSGVYPITSYLVVGGAIDLTEGTAFVDSELEGLNINELYFTVAPPSLPNLRFTVGQVDLTSYFDRNSFAKDAVTHFFNPVFQTNPALATSGLGSRQGIVANWAVNDDVRLALASFSSDRSISDFELDGYAGEVSVRLGNGIIRGTYVNGRDAGANDGPSDIFNFERLDGLVGIDEGDREEAFGLNAEYFVPEANLGLFARYGYYNNRDADFDASTVSAGINLLDIFKDRDRLGLAFGQNLSGDEGEFDNSNALEVFYDMPLQENLRAAITLQQRDDFSETVVGFRIRGDFNLLP
ncbi:MAG: hypothetical protein AAF289_01270 [Cyanobacteria bacterium P01_A01_bin.135]